MVIADDFRIIRELGRGGTGTVYLAHQESMEREVALKLLHPDLLTKEEVKKRFHQEAIAASKLNHPNIITIYQYGHLENTHTPFIAMEYLEGSSLDEMINGHPLDLEDALHIMKQICTAISAAHKKDIIHRDLKPENIFIIQKEDGYWIKVLDFGIAKMLNVDTSMKTRTGVLIGTPAYMSPEQIRGHTVTPRTDIYSLGLIFYEMMTGFAPWNCDNPIEYLPAHLNVLPRDPCMLNPKIPKVLADLILKALSKKPEDRISSADEFLEAIQLIETIPVFDKILPQSKIIHENLDSAFVKVKELLFHLESKQFNGALIFRWGNIHAAAILWKGMMTGAILRDGPLIIQGIEAFAAILQNCLKPGVDITLTEYGENVSLYVNSLVQGELMRSFSKVDKISFDVFLENLKNDKINGCVAVYSKGVFDMIFFAWGKLQGALQDGGKLIGKEMGLIAEIYEKGKFYEVFRVETFQAALKQNLLDHVRAKAGEQTTSQE
jgi:serine/threonine protein kinase